MKEEVKVSLIQFSPSWLKPAENAERMAKLAKEEANKKSELIVFPELSNLGYITPMLAGLTPSYAEDVSAEEFAMMYFKAAESVPGPTTELLLKITKEYNVYIVVGLARQHPIIPSVIYNSAILLGPLGIIGIYDKTHLPANEKLFFHAGNSIDVYATDIGLIGMCICYEGRFPEITRILSLKGAEIVCTIYNVPKVTGKLEHGTIRTRASCRAMENSNYNLSCNRAGIEGDAAFMGESTIAGPNGYLLACLDNNEEGIISARLLNEEIVRARSFGLTIFPDRRPNLYGQISGQLTPNFETPINNIPIDSEI